MALIDSTTLLKIADRIAWRVMQLVMAVDSIDADLGGTGTPYKDTLTQTDNHELEVALLMSCVSADDGITYPSIITAMHGEKSIIRYMEEHIKAYNPTWLTRETWDRYLQERGLLVSPYFNLVYKEATGFYLQAASVFDPGSTVFGNVSVDSVGQDVVFTDGDNYGEFENREWGNYAPAQLRIYVPPTAIGPTPADLEFILTGIDDTGEVRTMTVAPGNGIALSNSYLIGAPTDLWIDVTDVTFVAAGTDCEFLLVNVSNNRTILP